MVMRIVTSLPLSFDCQDDDDRSHDSSCCSCSWLRPGVWLQHSLSSHVLDTLAQRSYPLPPARLSDHRSVLSGSQWPMARNHSHHWSGEWSQVTELINPPHLFTSYGFFKVSIPIPILCHDSVQEGICLKIMSSPACSISPPVIQLSCNQ